MVLVIKWELASEAVNYNTKRCVKSFQIQGFSWSLFFRIRTQYFVSLCIQYNCGKIRTRKNSKLGRFSRSENHVTIWANLRTLQVKEQVSEAVVRRLQSLKTSQTPQENICVWVFWPAKETSIQMFSYEIYKISREHLFYRTATVAASEV